MQKSSAKKIREFIEPNSVVPNHQEKYYESCEFFSTALIIQKTIDEVEKRLKKDPKAIYKMQLEIRKILSDQSYMESFRS